MAVVIAPEPVSCPLTVRLLPVVGGLNARRATVSGPSTVTVPLIVAPPPPIELMTGLAPDPVAVIAKALLRFAPFPTANSPAFVTFTAPLPSAPVALASINPDTLTVPLNPVWAAVNWRTLDPVLVNVPDPRSWSAIMSFPFVVPVLVRAMVPQLAPNVTSRAASVTVPLVAVRLSVPPSREMLLPAAARGRRRRRTPGCYPR